MSKLLSTEEIISKLLPRSESLLVSLGDLDALGLPEKIFSLRMFY